MAVDPVCGMQVEEAHAAARVQHDGRTYYFCSEGCKERFRESPEKFVAEKGDERGRPSR